MCHSRYNERERVFVKIKNWASCIPEEVRKKDDFMPIYGFERLVNPVKVPSPFVGGVVKGPGGIGEPLEKAEGEKTEGGGTGRKRARRNMGGTEVAPGVVLQKTIMTAHTSGLGQTPAPKAYTAAAAPNGPVATSSAGATSDTKDRTMLTAAGTLTVPPIVDKLPAETSCVSLAFFFGLSSSRVASSGVFRSVTRDERDVVVRGTTDAYCAPAACQA